VSGLDMIHRKEKVNHMWKVKG